MAKILLLLCLGVEVALRAVRRELRGCCPNAEARLPLRQQKQDGRNNGVDSDDLTAANSYIEDELNRRLSKIEECTESDVIVCIHPIQGPFSDLIRDQIEDIKDRKRSLLVLLETEGGSIETAERIADIFRHHYKESVAFVVPNFAMSAGTILVMSGDKIYMDYYSVLGPIDPQIRNRDNRYVPALGYLEKFQQLIDKSSKGGLNQAELAFLVAKFDPAELHRFEQAREHSVDLLKRWLVQYKFKNWHHTETRGLPVTAKMKSDRAKRIAGSLNDTKKWRSHGRGLSIQVIKSDLKLEIEDFGEDPGLKEMNKNVRGYYRLLQDYMMKRDQDYAIHTRQRLFAF